MGMRERGVLLGVELPLGAPLLVAGVRIAALQVVATATLAAVQVVATATLGAVVAGGGLGRFIVDGFATGDDPQIFAGALLVAVLAILTELGFSLLERLVSPRTTSQGPKSRPEPIPLEQAAQVGQSGGGI